MVMMRGVLSPGPRGTVAVAPVPVTGLKFKAARCANLKPSLPAPRMVCLHDHLIGVFIIANYDGILLFIV
jgi:hypothetical protein